MLNQRFLSQVCGREPAAGLRLKISARCLKEVAIRGYMTLWKNKKLFSIARKVPEKSSISKVDVCMLSAAGGGWNFTSPVPLRHLNGAENNGG